MKSLDDLLKKTAALHRHLCPRQVLGVRMGLFAGDIFGLEVPQEGKRLLVIMETDGCASDGVAVATNCWVGRRTMRVEDYGKVAATFVDTETLLAVRIAPNSNVRVLAWEYAYEARNKWKAQLLGYQRMPVGQLLSAQVVQLKMSIEQIISRAGRKAICDGCEEEISNERQVYRDGAVLCRACAGDSYYDSANLEVAPFQRSVVVV